ncbi:MAG: flavin-containing monooxygenase [bacterium]
MSAQHKEGTLTLEQAREKYRQERDKRLSITKGRSDRTAVGDLAKYVQDPFKEAKPRKAVTDEVDVVSIGAGFAGLLVGARMTEAGFKRVRLIDTAGDVGGVWYWNRYPEAKCDVESLCYMPLLEETGYIPTLRYATAPEIFGHAQRIAKHFNLYEHSLFHTSVTDICWDDEIKRWHVHTDRGDDIISQYVVIAIGPMNTVRLPDIPGIEKFKGEAFHTSRWDYDYTGGSPTDTNLGRLADKTVGFIGTGATALQAVPPLAESSKKFYLFQRTPSTVGVRGNRPIDKAEVEKFEPGWQKKRQENFTAIWEGRPVDEDLVQDGWTYICREIYCSPRYEGLSGEALTLEKEKVDFDLMEEVRQRIDSIVKDPETAENLKPYYNYFCKRPGWHDEYLEAFNLPSAELVDTKGQGVEEVYEDGLIANGKKYPLDCLVYGTGFVTETTGKLKLGFDVIGRDGTTLAEKWKDGMTTLHGMTISKFPNLFVVPGVNAQAVVTVNVVHMTQEYTQHMAYIAKSVREQGMQVFDLSEEAESEWVNTIIEKHIDDTEFLEACTPGRNNYEGHTEARPRQNAVYGGGPIEYFSILKQWRERGGLPGLKLSAPLSVKALKNSA